MLCSNQLSYVATKGRVVPAFTGVNAGLKDDTERLFLPKTGAAQRSKDANSGDFAAVCQD
ncbi:MAG: hypothetical protein P1V29_01180 [Gammaproteobacteria bacterium]|nr:hypothetical protein [Gammaproteobacteria bacterium]